MFSNYSLKLFTYSLQGNGIYGNFIKKMTNPNLFNLKFNTFFTMNKINYNMNKIKSENLKNNVLIQYQTAEMRSMKTKRKLKLPDTKYKMKTHNALKKRIRVVGRLFDKGFKHWSNNHRHKMINKSSRNLKVKGYSKYVSKADIRHCKRMLPYFKRKKYRN